MTRLKYLILTKILLCNWSIERDVLVRSPGVSKDTVNALALVCLAHMLANVEAARTVILLEIRTRFKYHKTQTAQPRRAEASHLISIRSSTCPSLHLWVHSPKRLMRHQIKDNMMRIFSNLILKETMAALV